MKEKSSNKIEKILGFLIVLLLAIIITVVVMLSLDSNKLQDAIITLQNKYTEVSQTVQKKIMKKLEIEDGTPPDNIEFPEKEKLTEAQKYYYYEQLSETGKKIYITIGNNIERFKNGDDNIPLPPSLNEDAKNNEGGKDYIAKEFQAAWDAFITDKSEYFYLDSSKVCLVTKMTTRGSNTNYEFLIGKGDNANYFINEFNSKADVEKASQQIEAIKNEIVNNASGNNYEKMKYVHDWIIDNVKYDTTNGSNTSNIYGCLVNKNVVCEGYARTFKYLMDELNIPCVLVSGKATDENGKSERHAWNYVYIKNNWYAIDTTWDDPIIIGNGIVDDSIKYKYFLRGSNTMNQDHTTMGQITKDGVEFEYPVLSEDDIK